MAHTTRLINFTRDLKYSIVSAPAPLTLTVQKSLCTVLTSFCLKNHCRAEPMCTAAFTESFSLFLHRGRCPHRPLRKNPAPHKFPHIAAKTRYFSTFSSKAQIPLFGFSHFFIPYSGTKMLLFCAIRQFSRLKFYIVFTFHKVNMHNLSPQNYRILLTFLQYRLY